MNDQHLQELKRRAATDPEAEEAYLRALKRAAACSHEETTCYAEQNHARMGVMFMVRCSACLERWWPGKFIGLDAFVGMPAVSEKDVAMHADMEAMKLHASYQSRGVRLSLPGFPLDLVPYTVDNAIPF